MNIHVIEPLAVSDEKMKEMSRTLEEAGHRIMFFPDRKTDISTIVERSHGADVVVIANMPFPAEAVAALPDMKLLAVAFTGLDHVAMDACRDHGVAVCNASGYSTISVSELTLALIIDVLRNVTRLDPVTRAGGTKDGLVGFDLAGKTVGIIGLGAIGTYTARLLKAFGCRLLSPDRGKSVPADLEIELCSMEELLKNSDIVTLHCPLNENTRGLIGTAELEMMKESAVLINCARGPVVDETALAEALKGGKIAGAGVDVYTVEPPLKPESSPLLDLENAVLTPHVAFATREAFIRRADIVVDNILGWATGHPKKIKG